MYFLLSKTLGTFALPSNVIMTVAIVGLVLLPTRFARAGRRLLVGALLLLLIIAILPIGTALTVVLEQRFPRWEGTRTPPDGIIVLGGVINPEVAAARGAIVLGDAAERVTEFAVLARCFPVARIVFIGGNANVFGGPHESAFVKQLFESFGIPPSRVQIETQSRNTAENARFAKALINPKPGEHWLLVTSATHMPRAIGCFRKAEFPVEAYPVDWQTSGFQDLLHITMPPQPLLGLLRTDNATREWTGLFVYWTMGLTSELFPGPEQ